MSTTFEVREAVLSDIPVLVIHRKKMFEDIAFEEHTFYDPEKLSDMSFRYRTYLEDHMNTKSLRGKLITDNSKIVASGCVTLVEWIPSPLHSNTERAYIHSVYVEPDYRNLGLCTMLITAFCDELKSTGFFMVDLHASEAGMGVYERLGFRSDNSMRKNL
jgi:ribosomal protein S18 acetylase RimI-like enzyme